MKKFFKQFSGVLLGLFLIGFTFAAVVQWNNSKLELSQKSMLFTTDGTQTASKIMYINSGGNNISYGPLVDGGMHPYITGVDLLRTGDGVLLTPTQTTATQFQVGYGAEALGISSTAIGFGAKAHGYHSIAMGASTQSPGYASMAIGVSSKAKGLGATALGYNSIASGDNSTALGNNTLSLGVGSTSMGSDTIAKGDFSTVMGEFNIGYDNSIFEIGNGTSGDARNNAITIFNTGLVMSGLAGYNSIGNMGTNPEAFASKYYVDGQGFITGSQNIYTSDGTVTADRTVYMGGNRLTYLNGGILTQNFDSINNTAGSSNQTISSYMTITTPLFQVIGNARYGSTGNMSGYPEAFASKYYVDSNLVSSVFRNYNPTSGNLYSTVTGNYNIVLGAGATSSSDGYRQSIAIGNGARSDAQYGIAIGVNTNVINGGGVDSIAIGNTANSVGIHSTAIGTSAFAYKDRSIALGHAVQAKSTGSVVMGNYNKGLTNSIFEIGNGTGNDPAERHNVLTILSGGNVGIGTDTPTTALDVSSTIHTDMCLQRKLRHAYGGFQMQDTTIPVTQNIWAHVTNASGNLFTGADAFGMILSGDQFKILNTGHYQGSVTIAVGNSSNKDTCVRIYNVTQSEAGYQLCVTTSSTTNFIPITIPLFLKANANDIFEMQITNISNDDDPHVRSSVFYMSYVQD